ncbi:hypothetical protein H696_04192 [Fonticula alba]|uniref:Uncharacterized protein n=1 Tax=Fonticula alba TaxID=691883 RepID=A0A058Z656_FONAL|nr:hypothetical protein H696_04192 [Fonticula alba]KCV69779.1 hypothetical protein H696_04192 [Fonticula alba]|eukprot:XP_009496344.1 hypothetical protein H696_04192 [Fonticula alba]
MGELQAGRGEKVGRLHWLPLCPAEAQDPARCDGQAGGEKRRTPCRGRQLRGYWCASRAPHTDHLVHGSSGARRPSGRRTRQAAPARAPGTLGARVHAGGRRVLFGDRQ